MRDKCKIYTKGLELPLWEPEGEQGIAVVLGRWEEGRACVKGCRGQEILVFDKIKDGLYG